MDQGGGKSVPQRETLSGTELQNKTDDWERKKDAGTQNTKAQNGIKRVEIQYLRTESTVISAKQTQAIGGGGGTVLPLWSLIEGQFTGV